MTAPAKMLMRLETAADRAAIHALTTAAFAPMRFSDGTEADLVDLLRESGDLTLSLVAESDGKIIGHAAFSPAEVSGSDGQWMALGPISVTVGLQRQGIGRKLIDEGCARLARARISGIVLTGNPAVYEPCGFSCDGALHHTGTPDKNVLWRSLDGTRASGHIRFAAAFGDDRGQLP